MLLALHCSTTSKGKKVYFFGAYSLRFQLPYAVKKSAITQGKAVSASSASCPKTVTAFSDPNRQVVLAGSNSRSKQCSFAQRKSTEYMPASRKRSCDQVARHHYSDGIFRSVRQLTMSDDEYRRY